MVVLAIGVDVVLRGIFIRRFTNDRTRTLPPVGLNSKITLLFEPSTICVTVSRERGADESWADYMASGAITLNGVLANGVSQSMGPHRGIISKGVQPSNRLRPLEIIIIHGWYFEDTCAMVKAFMEGADPGLYECIWPGDPQQYTENLACPTESSVNKIA